MLPYFLLQIVPLNLSKSFGITLYNVLEISALQSLCEGAEVTWVEDVQNSVIHERAQIPKMKSG